MERLVEMTLQENIKRAIGAHGMWKTRLREAIETGKSELLPAQASLDNTCEFGKWLYGQPNLKSQSSQQYELVRTLHADFHKEVARILSMVAAGKKAEAAHELESGTNFANLSAALTRAMLDWSKSS